MADSFSAKATGPVQVAKAAIPEAQEYSQQDIEDAVRLFGALGSRPDLIPTTFLAYLQDYFSSADPLTLTTSSLLDFARFTIKSSDFVPALEATPSVSYADMVNVGPTLSSLPDGRYLVIVSAIMRVNGTSGDGSYMSPSINGSNPSDADGARNNSLSEVGVAGFSLQTLTAGNNTIVAKYRVSTGTSSTASFSQRKMFALRYANL